MTERIIDPRSRFLRVVRSLALISGVMTPVSFVMIGCSGNDTQSPGAPAEMPDTKPDVAVDGNGGTSAGPDTGGDVFTGIDAGISITDSDIADGDATNADAEIGIGGPLVAPEYPHEEVMT